ncbi:MAG: EVE domain-containing protein [Chthoniobacterales bacterium]|nr:EVE domain-containing protein [Chthoniobacterales bacterium]
MLTPKGFFLVKQEPADYPWDKFVAERQTAWTGVRNFQARNFLRQMRVEDLVLYYHSGKERAVVGVAKVIREAYPDPTAHEGDWFCVDLQALLPLPQKVSLSQIKSEPTLSKIPLVKQSRLSVMSLSREEFDKILRLGGITLENLIG